MAVVVVECFSYVGPPQIPLELTGCRTSAFRSDQKAMSDPEFIVFMHSTKMCVYMYVCIMYACVRARARVPMLIEAL
jgi:uncharacterized membrane protein